MCIRDSPKREELLEAVRQARQANLEAYVDTLQQQPLMKKLPRPGRIVKEKKNDKFGFTEQRCIRDSRQAVDQARERAAHTSGGNKIKL